jgi:hypothetical protein
MTRLALLQSRLSRLRRRRRALAWGTGWSGLGLALGGTLALSFLLDWTLEMQRTQRLLWFALSAGFLVWAFRRFTLPHLGRRETELDMALRVQAQEGIDSDLVAGLQFELRGEESWGSAELQEAVIERVAAMEEEIDVFRGLSARPLLARAAPLAVVWVALAGSGLLFPDHARVFLDRLLLGSRHYPSRTVIEELTLNGKRVELGRPAERAAAGPYGRPLRFQVRCSGALPRKGEAALSSLAGGGRTAVELKPGAAPGTYLGELPRLIEPLTYQLRIGDAWTEPARVEVLALPAVNLTLEATPPDYARSRSPAAAPASGARQLSVIEGSRVKLGLVSQGKRLERAAATLGAARELPLKAEDAEGRGWLLEPEGTVLERLTEPLGFSIQVVDEDGLELETPLEGSIRIQPDRPPRVTAAVITPYVLPGARPRISYGAVDDYGIARLVLRRQVTRAAGATEEGVETILDLAAGAEPQAVLRGAYALELSPLSLLKGDQLTITLEAIDFRGTVPGKSSLSEPLLLHVTDERGVLAAMVESDERSARQLDLIIERQLGIGASP